MNFATYELNLSHMRPSQFFAENTNSFTIIENDSALSFSQQIPDFPQKTKIAEEFMKLESQVKKRISQEIYDFFKENGKRIEEQRTKLKDFQEKFKEVFFENFRIFA